MAVVREHYADAVIILVVGECTGPVVGHSRLCDRAAGYRLAYAGTGATFSRYRLHRIDPRLASHAMLRFQRRVPEAVVDRIRSVCPGARQQ